MSVIVSQISIIKTRQYQKWPLGVTVEKVVALIQLLQMLQYNSSTNALNVSVFHNTGSLCPSLASLHLAALSNQPPNSIKAVRAAWSVSVQTGHEGGDHVSF